MKNPNNPTEAFNELRPVLTELHRLIRSVPLDDPMHRAGVGLQVATWAVSVAAGQLIDADPKYKNSPEFTAHIEILDLLRATMEAGSSDRPTFDVIDGGKS